MSTNGANGFGLCFCSPPPSFGTYRVLFFALRVLDLLLLVFENLHRSVRKNDEFEHGQHNLVILLLLLHLHKLPLHCRNDIMLSFLARGVVPAVQLVLDFLDQEKDVGTLPAGRYTAKRVVKEHTKEWNAVRLASMHMPLPVFERVVNRYHPHFSVWLLSEALASAEQELVMKRSLAKAWASLRACG